MLGKIFAIVGMLALIAFMGIVTVFVMEPDLWFITILVLAIGIIFFVREFKEVGDKSESRPWRPVLPTPG
jgi:hypothetical protein